MIIVVISTMPLQTATSGGGSQRQAPAASSEARLAALEATVQSLAQMLQLQGLGGQEHFIPESLRPLVGGGSDDGSQGQ